MKEFLSAAKNCNLILDAQRYFRRSPEAVTVESYVRSKSYEAIIKTNKKVKRAFIGAALPLGTNIEILNIAGYAPPVSFAKSQVAMLLLILENSSERVLEIKKNFTSRFESIKTYLEYVNGLNTNGARIEYAENYSEYVKLT